jgi:hypothetical protein
MNELKLKDSINITNNFSAIRTKKGWSRLEQIILYTLTKSLEYDFKQLRKAEFSSYKIVDIDVSNISNKIRLNRENLILMGFDKHKFSREIKEVSNSLLDKKIITSHPERVGCKESFAMANWFNSFFYDKKTGYLDIEVNDNALRLLKYFFKYSRINPNNIINLKSTYAFNIYIAVKVDIDSSKGKCKQYKVSLSEFRDSFDINEKYRSINMLKKKVLDLIAIQISAYTDLNLSYELEKNGRSYNNIKFSFDYKPEYIEEKTKLNAKKIIEPQIIDGFNIANNDSYNSLFESTLVGWGIRAKRVGELEEEYSLDVIQSAIDLTLEKEKAGEIKTTKAAIFLGILENKKLASDEQFERSKIEIEKQQDKQFREQVSAEYDKLSAFVLANEDIIKSALTTNTKYLPITDKDAIPVFKKIKSIDADKYIGYTTPILNFYHFESNSNVSSTLSDIVNRSQYIKVETYKDDMAIVQAYKQALDKIKEDGYITDEQKDILKKEVHDTINLLLGL